MPAGYDIGLYIHLLAVFAIAGELTTFVVCIAMMRRARTVEALRPWADVGWAAEKVFPVAALVLLLSASYMVGKRWAWDDGWVNVSAATLIVMAVADVFVNGRKIGAIRRAGREAPDGPLPRILAAQVTDPILFGTTHALITATLAVIWNMTVKPGSAEAAIAVLVAVVVGAGSAVPMISRQQAILEGANGS